MLKNNPVIIISRTDRIGDLILSIPAIKRMRDMYPKAKIIVLVRNYNYDIVKHLPYVDKVIKIDNDKDDNIIQKIKSYHPDIFIALFTDKNIGKNEYKKYFSCSKLGFLK